MLGVEVTVFRILGHDAAVAVAARWVVQSVVQARYINRPVRLLSQPHLVCEN